MTQTTEAPARPRSPLYSALNGLSAGLVLLQGVSAGLFLRENADYDPLWTQVHGLGGLAAVVLAVASLVVAVLQLRGHKAVVVGTAVFTGLLVVEQVLGFVTEDVPGLAAVHIPVGMLLMALAVYLPMRARRG